MKNGPSVEEKGTWDQSNPLIWCERVRCKVTSLGATGWDDLQLLCSSLLCV